MTGVPSHGPAPAASPADPLAVSVARQRSAILSGDPAEIAASGEALLARIEVLRAAAARGERPSAGALRDAREALRVNAELLRRAQSANLQALAAMFGSDLVYGPQGDGRLANTSLPIDAA